ILGVMVAILSSMLGSMNGFVFSRWRFPGAQTVFTLFLFGMFIPYQAVMIPLTGMMLSAEQAVPWFTGIAKLIVVHTIFGIPICTLIFRNYYATAVPNDILEAAKIDGAGMWRIYRSVVLPISIPAFVVTLIWQFTSAWNDFLFALFLTNRNNGPVTFVLNELAGGQNPDYPQIMAGVLVASLPTLLVYILLGRYFIGGLMSGSVKGGAHSDPRGSSRRRRADPPTIRPASREASTRTARIPPRAEASPPGRRRPRATPRSRPSV